MSSLSSRLARIRAAGAKAPTAAPPAGAPEASRPDAAVPAAFLDAGWSSAAPLVLGRSARVGLPRRLPPTLDSGLAVLCRFPEAAGGLDSGRILFFDLETTGLSGGAGTVAFLAAFARIVPAEGTLEVVQYLLLDYPGEAGFLGLAAREMEGPGTVLCTYNGKGFDAQILRTRCLMNGLRPPSPAHLDLVHPARRLWRRVLGRCSLVELERGVLGLERGEDLAGSEAPDAWFDFLRTGGEGRLLRACLHNERDLAGLAGVLAAIESVARDPTGAAGVDREGLALRWLAAAREAGAAQGGPGAPAAEDAARLARVLLEAAAGPGFPRASFALARRLRREGREAEAKRYFILAGEDEAARASLRASAFAAMAAGEKDRAGKLAWIERALSTAGLPRAARARLEERRLRLST